MKHMKIWTMMAAALFAVSCSNSDVEEVAKKNMADTPITFTAGVNTLVTRSGHEGTLTEGEIGLYLSTEGAKYDDRYNAYNVKVTRTNGTWVTENMLLWKSNSAKVSYSAYLPYQEELSITTFPIVRYREIEPSVTQTAETILNDDLLYASDIVTAEESPNGIALSFKHKLALLKICLTKATEVDEDVVVSGVQVTPCSKKIAMNVENGELFEPNNGNGTTTVSMYGTKADEATSNFNDTWEALLVPKTFAAGTFQLTVTVGTGNEERTFRYTSPNEIKLEEGTINTINLTIGRDKVIMGNVSAREWTDGTGGTGETIETD